MIGFANNQSNRSTSGEAYLVGLFDACSTFSLMKKRLYSSKLKEFADYNFKFDENL